jgi:hypothetical protein
MPSGRGDRMSAAHEKGPRPGAAVDRPSQKMPPPRVAGRDSVSMNPASAEETPAASSVGRLPRYCSRSTDGAPACGQGNIVTDRAPHTATTQRPVRC